jgi:DinB family
MMKTPANTDECPVAIDGATDSDLCLDPCGHPADVRSSRTAPAHQYEDARRIVTAAIAILMQGEDMLRTLSVEAYTQRVPVAFNACIGGHYRHCLDHFTSLLQSFEAEEVDYDHRDRDTRIESQPDFALQLTQRLRAQLERLPPSSLTGAVRARCEVSYADGNPPVTGSTFGREMVYAIAHAVHHYALICVMARLMDAKLPEHFGVAP